MKVSVVNRPISVSLPAGEVQLTRILENIESAKARAAQYGLGDAPAFTGASELAFSTRTYRQGSVVTSTEYTIKGFNYARASAATDENSAGAVANFAADEPRITDRGLLVEGGRTNLLTWSNAFDNAAWEKLAGGTGAAPVVTANAAVAPDGSMTADRVVFSRGGGDTNSDLSLLEHVSFPTDSGSSYALSFWVKGLTAGTLLARHVASGAYTLIEVTTDWQRVPIVEAAFSTTGGLEIGLRGANSSASLTVDLAFAQVEKAPWATSYIPTEASAVARPTDATTWALANFAGEGSLYIDATTGPNSTANQVLAEWSDGGADNRIMLLRSPDRSVRAAITVGGEPVYSGMIAETLEDFTRVRGVIRWTGGVFSVVLDGAIKVEGITNGRLPVLNTITLGTDQAGSNALNGHIRTVIAFGAALSPLESIQMTRTSETIMRRIAAFDSTPAEKARADIVCDGVDDQIEINASLAQGGTTELFDGTYNVSLASIPEDFLTDDPTLKGALLITEPGTVLKGQGWNTIIRLNDGQFGNVVRTLGDGLDNLRIRDLFIEPNRANNLVGTGMDWLEICAIKTKTTGAAKNRDIWIEGVRTGPVEGLGVYLWGDDVHLRGSQIGCADHDAAELCGGSKGDITGCTLIVEDGQTGGHGFGSDDFNDATIAGNTTVVREGGHISVGVHRMWVGRYRNQIVNNKIVSEGGRINAAIQAHGYNTVISGNSIRGHDNYGVWGMTRVEANTTTVIQSNTMSYCELVTTQSGGILQTLPTAAEGVCAIRMNILEDCVAPAANAQTIIGDNVEYAF